MFVTDAGNEMCWWQPLDVGDGFGHFGYHHQLSFYISVGHQHSKDATKIEILSPTFKNCHHLKVTNITVTLKPTWEIIGFCESPFWPSERSPCDAFLIRFFIPRKSSKLTAWVKPFIQGFSVVVNTLKQFRYSSENPPNSSGLIPKRWNASALSIPEKYMVTYKLKKLTWTRSPWKKYFHLKTYSKKMKIWKTKVAFFVLDFSKFYEIVQQAWKSKWLKTFSHLNTFEWINHLLLGTS